MKRFLAVVSFLFAASAQAGLDRTAVSVNGSDLNPCSVAQPCATFLKAIGETNAYGELIALDSGAYDGFTVDRFMTVTAAPGAAVVVGLQPGKTYAINVNAPGQRVTIRGISVKVAGSVHGIWVHDAAATFIQDVVLEGNGCVSGCGTGIFGRRGEVHVHNATVRNFFNGISHNPLEPSHMLITDSIVQAQRSGILVDNYARATVRNTVVSRAEQGFTSASSSSTVRPELTIIDCTATENGVGVQAGWYSTVRMERTAVHRNTTGISNIGGTFVTHGNNMVAGNTTNVSGTITAGGLM